MSRAAQAVLAERQRQVRKEGWSIAHDDGLHKGSLSAAAACYILHKNSRNPFKKDWFPFWPWSEAYWNPKSERKNLVRAGALILAEIERLDRAENGT